MNDITQVIFSDPVYHAAATLIVAIIATASRQYLGPEDDWIEEVKLKWTTRLDPITRPLGVPLVLRKGLGEYVTSSELTPDEFERQIHQAGYVENDLSFQNFRVINGTRQYAVGSMKYSEPYTSRQWHLYIFPGHNGYGVDVYQHGEEDWDPTRGGGPKAHLEGLGNDINADPDDVLKYRLEEFEIPHERSTELVA